MKAIPPPRPELAARPVRFQVGTHAVIVELQDRRWKVSIDGAPASMTFPTEAEAWEAGVREADRLDRPAAG